MSSRLPNISVMKSATNSGLIVGYGIGIPSSSAVLSDTFVDACLACGLTPPSGVPALMPSWRLPTFFPAIATSLCSSPARVCGTSRVSSGDFTSHNG